VQAARPHDGFGDMETSGLYAVLGCRRGLEESGRLVRRGSSRRGLLLSSATNAKRYGQGQDDESG
jgi:hypothetical protein